MSAAAVDVDPAVGLCAQCLHSQRIRTARGSTFYLCRRAAIDPAFSRYPNLPVVQCAGFERMQSAQASDVKPPR